MHTDFSGKLDFSIKVILEFIMCFPKLSCLCCVSMWWIFQRSLKGTLNKNEKKWETKDVTAVRSDIPQLWKRCPTPGRLWNTIFPSPAILHSASTALAPASSSSEKDCLYTPIAPLLFWVYAYNSSFVYTTSAQLLSNLWSVRDLCCSVWS